MRRHRNAVRIVVSALVLIGLNPVDTASANHLSCGAVITTNTVLDSNIGPCPSGGLRVVSSGITVDLNGFSVFGGPAPGDGTGIHLFRVSSVTVKNGSVRSFDMGVAIEGGSGNTVQGITARDNIGSNSTNGGDGIAILSSEGNRILANTVDNNGAFSGIGLYTIIDAGHPRTTIGVSTNNLIQGNQVRNNVASRFGDVTTTDNIGIRVEPNTPGNHFINNQVVGNGLDGITLFVGADRNVIRGNSVLRNGLVRTTVRRGNGIGLQSLPDLQGASFNLIENNLVAENGDNGIVLRGPRGNAQGAINNIVRNNTAVHNATLPLLGPAFGPAFDLNDDNPNCDNNVWSGNRYITVDPPCAAG